MVREIWLIRHPQFKVLKGLRQRTPQPDVKMLLSKAGLTQAIQLVDHLYSVLGEQKHSVEFFSSPYRRAKSLADIVLTNLKLSATSSCPKLGGEVKKLKELGEVHFRGTGKTYWSLFSRGVEAFDEHTQTHPEVIVKPLEKKRKEMLKAIEKIKKTRSGIALAFTHRMSIAALLWHLQNAGKEREITEQNIREIHNIAQKIAHTAIIKLRTCDDGRIELISGERLPHIRDNDLISGVPKAKKSEAQ